MKPLRITLATAFTAALLAGGASAAEWKRLESEHFRIYTDQDTGLGRDLLAQLEQLRWLGLRLMGGDDKGLRAQARFDTTVLRGRQTLRQVFPQVADTVAGVYMSCREGAMSYVVETGEASRYELSVGQQVLQHEYAHHLMFQYAAMAYPAWYVEGFAEYLSTARQDGTALVVGDVSPYRAMTLESGWLPAEDVLAWHTRSNERRAVSDTMAFYAQSWLLTHYMLGDEGRARRLTGYFERVGRGEDPVAAFEPATGIAVTELNDRLRRYYRGGVPTLSLRGQDLPRLTVQATSLGADADAYFAEASALRVCVSPERGRALLARLRALAPEPLRTDGELRLALARAEALVGDPVTAVALLERAADEDAESHYLLGRAWGRHAESPAGDEQREARERERSELMKAYRLRKEHAPTLYFLARALELQGGSDQNVLNAARAARLLAPTVPEYAVLAAQLELRAGERERAARALGPLASNPHDPIAAARARAAMQAIRDGKTAKDAFAPMFAPQPTTP